MKPKHLAACAAVTAGVLMSVSLAAGQDAAPVPGCQGIQLVDKKGDNSQPSTDILNVFYTTTGGKTYANLQLADIKAEIPEGSTQWYWIVEYTSGEDLFRLVAFLKGDGSSGFKARKLNRFPENPLTPGVFTDVGELAGRIVLGKQGVVQWELADAVGAAVGAKLVDHFAAADEVVAGEPYQGGGYLRVVASIDNTTNVASKEYVVRDCPPGEVPGPGSGTGASPTPSPGTPPPPSTTNPPQPTTGPISPGNPDGGQAKKLDLKVSKKVPRARKVRRSLKLKLTSRSGATDLEAILVSRGKKGKVVARGKLKTLGRKGTLKMRVSRKIKKGVYRLQIAGRNADGSGGTATVKLRFK